MQRPKRLAAAARASHKLPLVESAPELGGSEWLVDAFGCDPERLRSLDRLAELGRELVARLELKVIGETIYQRSREES